MRDQLSAVLGVPPEKIRVIAEEVGGGFGVRFNAYPEYGALLFAAKKLGRPVKWIGTRSEVFLADEQARDIAHTRRAGARRERPHPRHALRLARPTSAPTSPRPAPFINTIGLVNVHCGVYDVQAVLRARPAGAHQHRADGGLPRRRPAGGVLRARAPGRPGGARARPRPGRVPPPQHHPEGKMPYKLAGGFEYDCGDFAGGDGQGARRSPTGTVFRTEKSESQKRRQAARPRHRHLHRDDRRPAASRPTTRSHMHLGRRTARVTLRTASHNHGQGHETTFAQIVSGVLGIPMETIRLRTSERGVLHRRQPDRRLAHAARPGQRDACCAAQEIVKNGMALAAEHLESAAADIEFDAGQLPDQGHRPHGAHRRAGEEVSAASSTSISRTGPRCRRTFPNGCHVAEVEIEPETGDAEIVSYVACDDAGNIINHQIVEGQMQGGVTQGAGHVFSEHGGLRPRPASCSPAASWTTPCRAPGW